MQDKGPKSMKEHRKYHTKIYGNMSKTHTMLDCILYLYCKVLQQCPNLVLFQRRSVCSTVYKSDKQTNECCDRNNQAYITRVQLVKITADV